MPGTRWTDLSRRRRRLLVAAAAIEGVVKLVALVDLARRPAREVRGSKPAWAVAIVVLNSIGVVPAAYLLMGRAQPAGRRWSGRPPGAGRDRR